MGVMVAHIHGAGEGLVEQVTPSGDLERKSLQDQVLRKAII